MAPKKKQPKNAFFFFMQDWKAEKEEQGQRFANLKEVSELCAEDWKHLPYYNMNKYKQMEKEAKKKDKDDLSNKYNSLGVTFEEIGKQQNAIEREKRMMEEEIDQTMRTLSASKESLMNHCFYLAHANVYCYWGQEKAYIPCELAISKFNLKEGLIDTYHVFPAPYTKDGFLPLGYKFEARTNAETVHDIPDPTEFDKLEFDWNKIRREVCQFLKPHGGKNLPPIYTMDGDDSNTNCYMSAVKTFFELVADDSGDSFRVYCLPTLFFTLYGTCQSKAIELYQDKEVAFPVVGIARQQLMKDVYNFSPGICCDFHEPLEHYHNCSLSFVKRWVFLISEFCCKALRIELIPGRHCLTNAKVVSFVKHEAHGSLLQSKSKQQVSKQPLEPSKGAWSRPPQEDDSDSDGGGAWSTVNKVQQGMKNLRVNNV